MDRDPLDEVYSFVERTYFRLQASDVLNRCLEDSTLTPIQQMVEQLILTGPRSLIALREIREEVGQRKTQVREDLHQILHDFEHSLDSYGVNFDECQVETVVSMSRSSFVRFLSRQGINEKSVKFACLQVLKDCRELVDSSSTRLQFLDEIESYLQDWMWGMAVQSAMQKEAKDGTTISSQ